MRYNLFNCVQINASAAPGYSSAPGHGRAGGRLPQDHAHRRWASTTAACRTRSRRRRRAFRPATIFGLAFFVVFLIMAAQYESWTLPFSVLLGVPIAVFGAFVALYFRRLDNNVYAQIGLVMLIGLSAKNAILIVEFAKMEYDKGATLDRRRSHRRKTATAAHPDDGLRLHPRLRAAVDGDRRRRHLAAGAGNGRDRRHAGGHAAGHLLHPRQLRCGGALWHMDIGGKKQEPQKEGTGPVPEGAGDD